MIRSKVPLRAISDIIAICIILHNFCIVNKVNKLKMNGLLKHKINQQEELTREKYERAINYRERKSEFAKVKVMILTREDATIVDEKKMM